MIVYMLACTLIRDPFMTDFYYTSIQIYDL